MKILSIGRRRQAKDQKSGGGDKETGTRQEVRAKT